MKPTNPRSTGQHALMLAAAISTFAAVDCAEACTVGGSSSTFASNSTVDCSGATDGGQINGYGTPNDNNNTYTIHDGVGRW